jgi:phosphatidylglycerol:prolipoprotein diacylglycerol transferase
MTFPVYFHLAGYRIHPHPVLEVVAYTVGFQMYCRIRRQFPAAAMPFETNLWILVGALFGALAGSKLLAFIESGPDFWAHRFEPGFWMGGKTILGGLLGGWLGVEIAKHLAGVKHSTGDAFVFPLITGMAIGRIGCFLTGLDDHTYGIATALPWGVDFGDGIRRHPTQLYDIIFLAIFGIMTATLLRRISPSPGTPGEGWGGGSSKPPRNIAAENPLPIPPPAYRERGLNGSSNGKLFLLFMAAYCTWRFFVEFLKPTWKPIGISPIQTAALCGMLVAVVRLSRLKPRELLAGDTYDAIAEHP